MKLMNIVFLSVIFCLSDSCTSNWPQFRGPDSNQLTKAKNLPEEWSDEKNIEWKYKLSGRGWSTPVVWGDKVFFTSAVLEDPTLQWEQREGGESRLINPSDAEYRWEVCCLDANTGKELWKQISYGGTPTIPTHSDNTYASETPVTDGKRVYVYFGMTGLFVYDYEGNLVWGKDLGNYPTRGNWGTATSPSSGKTLCIYRSIMKIIPSWWHWMQNQVMRNGVFSEMRSLTGAHRLYGKIKYVQSL